MPQKVLKFTGINRKVNEFQNTGACEELINLRPDIDGACRAVKDKEVYIEDAQYDLFVEHSWGDRANHIAVENGVVKWMNTPDGSADLITDEFRGKKVAISSAGHVLVVYCESKKQQAVFKFKDDEYKPYAISIPRIIGLDMEYEYNWQQPSKGVARADDTSVSALSEAFGKACSDFYNSKPNGLCGTAVIGCAYELDDGSEVWSTGFIVADATKIPSYDSPIVSDDTGAVVYGARTATLKLEFEGYEDATVKKVNIYASKPLFPYEVVDDGGLTSQHAIVRKNLDDLGLDNQIMYFQGSVEPNSDTVSFKLDFGIAQASNQLMRVLHSCNERVGESVSYNNRFHYYRCDDNHIIQRATVSETNPTTPSYWICYVKFDGEWKLLRDMYVFADGMKNDFIYPMAGVKQLAFVKGEMSNGFKVPYTDVFFVNMKNSDAYNYSYAFDVEVVTETLTEEQYGEWHNAVQMWGYPVDKKVLWKKEINAINVSAPYNPFVFPVEYSYSFGGEILDVCTSYLPISATEIGQYPVTVFTSAGIYAIAQGDSSSLYGNILPLQPHTIEGKALSTPHGTFFVSSSSLFILSGRETANVSYVMNGEMEKNLKESESYKALCCNDAGALHSFAEMLSSMDFCDFLTDATLTYDQLNNEVIISNKYKTYSYVFNIDTKSYHKVAKTYLQSNSNARYVLEDNDGIKSVVDMHTEKMSGQQNILLQSRPFALEAFFTHIQRLILFVDAKLNAGQNLCFSVFASDNLSDWKCIISAQKKDTVLRQIRTNKAAKSYRDYVILINGTVGTDTDLAEIIADYTVVSRRLG